MGRKPITEGLKSRVWTRRKKNIQPEENEETRIPKNERLRNLQDMFKHSNIQIIGVPEGEEEEQELKTCLNK